jgi:hypothetical protein
MAGEVIEVSNVKGQKLIKDKKASLVSATKKKRNLKKMKKEDIVEEKKLGATFVFEKEDTEDIANLSLDVMTFKAVYKTYLAINRFCLENNIDTFYLVLVDNSMIHKVNELKTLSIEASHGEEIKEILHKFFDEI